jgi:hypothetical protein
MRFAIQDLALRTFSMRTNAMRSMACDAPSIHVDDAGEFNHGGDF